jgi:hypothetical protein
VGLGGGGAKGTLKAGVATAMCRAAAVMSALLAASSGQLDIALCEGACAWGQDFVGTGEMFATHCKGSWDK